MKIYKVAGIGEILWDLFPEDKKLGGAPANFTYHAQTLGAQGFMISAVGDDLLGREIIDQLGDINLDTSFIQVDPNYPTGTVDVILDNQGKPDFKITRRVAWDYISFTEKNEQLAGKLDAICFGTLAQRSEISRESIRRMIESTPDHCLRIFDINLRQNYYNFEIINDSLKQANCLKLNEEEFSIIAKMFSLSGQEQDILDKILSRFDLNIIALTKGKEGSILHTGEDSSYLKSTDVQVIDTVGAGDAFTAALGLGLLNTLPLKTIHEQATLLSAYVCTQNGATPVLPETMCRKLIEPFGHGGR